MSSFALGVGSPALFFFLPWKEFPGEIALLRAPRQEGELDPLKVFSISVSDFISSVPNTGADGTEWKPVFPFRGWLSIPQL